MPANAGSSRPKARTWTAAQNWTITAIANILNKTERELNEVFSGADFTTLMEEGEDWKEMAGKSTVPPISRITTSHRDDSTQLTSDRVRLVFLTFYSLITPSLTSILLQLYSEIMKRGVEKYRALLSLGPTAIIVDDDFQTMSRLYSCNARRKTRTLKGQETHSSTMSKPKSLPIRQSPTSPTAAGSSSTGCKPPFPAEPRSQRETGKRPASASSLDLQVPYRATRPKTSIRMPTKLLVRWINPKPDAINMAAAQDLEAVAKTFNELVGWVQSRFRLQEFGCEINPRELRCSTLPPPDGAGTMFNTMSFDNTVLTASQFEIAVVVADVRGQLWLTFETIDDATRRSSPETPSSADGGRPSGGENGVIYVRTTTKSSLAITAPAIKREGSTSRPPEINIPAPAAIEDGQPEKRLGDVYESDKDLPAPIFRQNPRSRTTDDEPDSESESDASGYAVDDSDIILQHEVDHNKLSLGESDVHLNAESQALAVNKDDTDYDWYVL